MDLNILVGKSHFLLSTPSTDRLVLITVLFIYSEGRKNEGPGPRPTDLPSWALSTAKLSSVSRRGRRRPPRGH